MAYEYAYAQRQAQRQGYADLSPSTRELLRKGGSDPEAFKREVLSRLRGATPAQVFSTVKQMGQSHLFTEQDLRYFLARTGMNRAMQEAYVQAFHEAERGAFDTSSMWEELSHRETWSKRVILKAISNILTIAEDLAIAAGDVLGYTPAAPLGWLIQFGGSVSSVIHDVVDYKLGLKDYEEAKRSMISTVFSMIPYIGDPVDVHNIAIDMMQLGELR